MRAIIALVIITAWPASATADEEQRSAERPPPAPLPSSTSRGGVALTGSYGVVNGNHAQVYRATELHAVAAPVGRTFFGVVAGVAEGISTSTERTYAVARPHGHYDHDNHAYWELWFGPQVAWGAPFRASSRWGVSLQSGLSAGMRDRTLYSTFGNDDPARYLGVFGAVSVRLALCRCQTVRPFVGVGGRTVLGHFGDFVQSAGIDVGLAFAP